MEKVPGGCWLWTGATVRGYGKLTRGGRGEGHVLAHRLSYELLIGPIPDGLQIDHLCRVRNCVNPDHLEAVTQLENIRRAPQVSGAYCKHGHERTPENTYVRKDRPGYRHCRVCAREAKRRRYRSSA